jgi:hypothetical protein
LGNLSGFPKVPLHCIVQARKGVFMRIFLFVVVVLAAFPVFADDSYYDAPRPDNFVQEAIDVYSNGVDVSDGVNVKPVFTDPDGSLGIGIKGVINF